MRIKLLLLSLVTIGVSNSAISQLTCLTYSTRNNGNNANCPTIDNPPSAAWTKTGTFDFTNQLTSVNYIVDSENGSHENDKVNYEDVIETDITISFGEKLDSRILSISEIEDYSWTIFIDNNTKIKGEGNKIYDVLFDKPGQYEVLLNHRKKPNDRECQHQNEQIKLRLSVLDYKYKFLFDELVLSRSLKGNTDASGIILTVPIIFSSYYNNLGDLSGLKMISSGLNTSLIGEVMNVDKPLQIGKNIISFKLSGKAISNTYIMFDFYRQNKSIQTYYLPNVIK